MRTLAYIQFVCNIYHSIRVGNHFVRANLVFHVLEELLASLKGKRKIAIHTWILLTTEEYHYRSNSYVYRKQSIDFCISDIPRAGDRRAPRIE